MKKLKELLQQRVENNKQNQKGFSLVELIIVIAILGIIAAIALPNITNAVGNSRKTTDVTNARTIANAAIMVRANNESLAETQPKVELTKENVEATGDDAVPFIAALAKELNGGVPEPKHEKDGVFVIEVTSNGEVKVYVRTTEDSTSNDVEVYPNTDSTYNNK